MALARILITVKTYPTLSTKYDETVCTAGVLEDGSWVRLYPIPFRKLDYARQQYKKYQWLEVDIERNKKDPRPETFRPKDYERIKIVGNIESDSGAWLQRREFCLKKVYTNLEQLIAEAKNPEVCTSLAAFKPTRVLNFFWEKVEREWDKTKLAVIHAKRKQGDLFAQEEEYLYRRVKKLPYKFSYQWADDAGRETTQMIEDWEIGALFWNCLRRHGNDELVACAKVREKYFDDFAKTKDLYFFLGSTQNYHFIAPNPFVIIGTFHPNPIVPIAQQSLF